ncbi:hypothetical protein [Pseudactinotalea sp. Z1748]
MEYLITSVVITALLWLLLYTWPKDEDPHHLTGDEHDAGTRSS